MEYKEETKKCECPANSFWNGSECITCYLPKYFDLDSLECKECEPGFYFDRVKRYCVPKP